MNPSIKNKTNKQTKQNKTKQTPSDNNKNQFSPSCSPVLRLYTMDDKNPPQAVAPPYSGLPSLQNGEKSLYKLPPIVVLKQQKLKIHRWISVSALFVKEGLVGSRF